MGEGAAADRPPAPADGQRAGNSAYRGRHPRGAREHGPLRGRADARRARWQAGRPCAQSGSLAALCGAVQRDIRFRARGWRSRRRRRMIPSIESRASWVVASISLAILAVAFGGPWIAVVALKTIAAETGGARSVPAFASSLAWFGAGIGGIGMGQLADRYGVRWTALFGSMMIALG